MNKKFLLATKNKNKIIEFKNILNQYNIDTIDLNNVDIEEPVETGETFKENSNLKAKYYGDKMSCCAIADDSGLCITALNNFPSIYAGRYAKQCGGYLEAFNDLQEKLKDKQNKSAFFICHLSFYDFDKQKMYDFEGRIDGKIIFDEESMKSQDFFGYDPIFFPDGYDKSFTQIGSEIKNKISHRARAIEQFKDFLKDFNK